MLGFIDWTVSLLKLVCDFVYKHNFSQLVDCPTHVKGNILDLVFTTSESIISDLLVTKHKHPKMVQLRHKASFELYSYGKEMHRLL